jgi:hypothetical protein
MRGKTMVAAALLVAAGGCGEPVERAEGVPLERVPPDIMKVANKNLPGIKFNLARKIKVKGQDAYEIQGKDQRGKVREVEVSTAGKVLEIE